MLRFLATLALTILVIVALAITTGCASSQPQAAGQAYAVDAQGNVRPTVQAAVDPNSPDGGPVELIGVNIPFGPINDPLFAVKGGLVWYGTPGQVTIPVPMSQQAQGACGPYSSAQGVVMVPQTVYEEQRRVVPRTKMVPHVLVPAPELAPRAASCP